MFHINLMKMTSKYSNVFFSSKKLGMPVIPWFLYVMITASIGGMHMYARILYLEEKKEREEASAPLTGSPK